jgi:thiamine pyrophosphate-dependent acetolactate synthase large subunit-like protein
MNRRHAVATLLQDRSDLLVVSGLGSPSYDVMAAGDHDQNYYLWAAMGSAAMIGLGLATAQPQHKVLVITGDGEMLMGTGSLATIAVKRPKNLTIVVLDNGHYGETGMQLSHTGQGIALHKIAEACGFDSSVHIDNTDALHQLRSQIYTEDALRFATVRVDPANEPRVLPPRDGVHVKNRFRQSLGFDTI